MSLIARAASIALSDTHPPASTTPTSIRVDDRPAETFIPSSTVTLGSATAAAATVGSSRSAVAPGAQPASTFVLAAVVPVAAVSVTVLAIVFRMYGNRCEREQETGKHIPAELEAGKIPIELEARELGRERYSPGG